ncbi:MAG TPA: SDR family oxidoreductase [Dongiaceae bacterium]|nr:SDR family oxidoreductase [Dongiaceae bacterium]HVY98161.1 SDR family oxidoreductase [Dongiaceae bacterium]
MGVAIVTGAGTGVGAATARRLAAGGWDVALVGRRANLLEDVAAGIGKSGGRTAVIPADLAEAAAAKAVVDRTVAAFGAVDALVNNAAVIKVLPLADYTVEVLDQHWAVNIRAPFLLIQAALPHLRKQGGAVVNISSSSGTILRPGQSVYGMSKHALEYLSRSLAGELAADRIRVNTLALGPVDTPIHQTWATDLKAAYEWLAKQVPLGRIAQADEIARWVEILVSPDSGWMTGAVIPLDGGQVLDIA